MLLLLIIMLKSPTRWPYLYHSLPICGEYRSTTSLKHTHPLHILIGQSNTTHQFMESPSDGAFRKVFAQNTQDLHIWDHSLPLLGEYRSTTSLKHSEPLHILIRQSNTGHQAMIMQFMESPSDGAFRKVFAQNTHKMSSHSKNTRRDNIRRTKKTRTRTRTNTGTMRGKKYNDNKKKNNNTRRTKMTRTRTRTNNGTIRGKKNKEDKKKNKKSKSKSKSKSKNNSKKQEERTRTRRTMITMNQE